MIFHGIISVLGFASYVSSVYSSVYERIAKHANIQKLGLQRRMSSKTMRHCIVGIIFQLIVHLVNGFQWDSIEEKVREVCDTAECHERGKIYRRNMNESVKPCTDFFEYACGNWQLHNPPPKHMDEWTVYYKMERKSAEHLRDLLEKESPKKKKSKYRRPLDEMQARAVYRNCMDISSMKRLPAKDLKFEVGRLSYWPIYLEDKQEEKYRIPVGLVENHYARKTGESALFDVIVIADQQQDNIPLIEIKPMVSAYGTIMRYVQWKPVEKTKYIEFLLGLLKSVTPSFAAKGWIHRAKGELHKVLEFREKLEAIIDLSENSETDPRSSLKAKITEIQYYYNKRLNVVDAQINWLELIRSFYRDVHGQRIKSDTMLKLASKRYFYDLIHLLDATPQKVVANHIHLYFLERYLEYDSTLEALLTKAVITETVPTGEIRRNVERWELCIYHHNMKDTLGRMYVKDQLTENIKCDMEKLMFDVREVIELQIEDSWLNAGTKKHSKQALQKIFPIIGYPGWYEITLKRGQYVKNERKKRYSTSRMQRWISILEDVIRAVCRPTYVVTGEEVPFRREIPEQHGTVSMNPLQANARYTKPFICINAAYIQTPMYGDNLPYVINIASMGSTIGHETYHAFSLDNIKKKQKSRYIWPPQMLDSYAERAECFVDQQYESKKTELKRLNVDFKGLKVSNTMEEDIADTMGVKAAYETYRRQLWRQNGRCQVLPQFKTMSCDQMFFLAFANKYCGKTPPSMLLELIMTDDHSTDQLRVNGVVSNMVEFALAFECEKDDPMNPPQKCTIW